MITEHREILGKITELMARDGAFGTERGFDCGSDYWTEEVTDYNKIEDSLRELAEFILETKLDR